MYENKYMKVNHKLQSVEPQNTWPYKTSDSILRTIYVFNGVFAFIYKYDVFSFLVNIPIINEFCLLSVKICLRSKLRMNEEINSWFRIHSHSFIRPATNNSCQNVFSHPGFMILKV